MTETSNLEKFLHKRIKELEAEVSLSDEATAVITKHFVEKETRLRELTDNLAEQLAWFRREHNVAEPLLAAFRMVRNGRLTQAEFVAFATSERVDRFLRFREPSIPPHLPNRDVMGEIEFARIRLKIPEPGSEPEDFESDAKGDT